MNSLAPVQSVGFSLPASTRPPIVEILQVLLAAAWRRRYLVIIPILLLPILGGVVGHFVPKTYETKMSILIQEPGALNPFLADLSVKTDLKERMPALSELLTSRHVLQGVAVDLGMIKLTTPAKPATADTPATPEIAGTPEIDIEKVIAELAQAVSVQLIGQELVELRYRARTPVNMDKALMSIGQRFMERVEAPEDSSMRGSVAFLGKQLEDTTKRLEASESAVAEYRAKNAESLPDQRATNLQRLASLRDQLAEHEVRLAGAQTNFDETRSRLAQTDPVIGRLEQDIVSTRGDLAVLRSRYTDEHSKVQAALGKLKHLEEERLSLLATERQAVPTDMDRMWNLAAASRKEGDGSQPLLVSQVAMLQAARTNLEQLRTETENLRKAVTALSADVEASGDIERELDKRRRAVDETQDLVQSLRKRFEMAKVTSDLSRFQAADRINVIDLPAVPTKPMKPLTLLFTLGGLVGGLVLGAGLSVLLELSDTSVRRIRQMEALTGVPVLARLAAAN